MGSGFWLWATTDGMVATRKCGGPTDDGATTRGGGGPLDDVAAGVLAASNDAIRCIRLCGGSGGSLVVLFVMWLG